MKDERIWIVRLAPLANSSASLSLYLRALPPFRILQRSGIGGAFIYATKIVINYHTSNFHPL